MRRAWVLPVVLAGFVAAPAAAQQPAPDEAAAPPPLPQQALVASRGQVKRLQRALGVQADGALGPRTRTALRRWERRQGLAADGRPDPEGLARLGIALTRAQLSRLAPAPVGAAAAQPAPAPGPAAAQAVAAARTQLGTPYRRAGAAPGGFDCSGLTMWAFAQAGVALPHSSFAQAGQGTRVGLGEIRPGDLVLFDTAGPGASDVGIATGPTTVISATTHGVREHAIFDAYWGAHALGARRLQGGPRAKVEGGLARS